MRSGTSCVERPTTTTRPGLRDDVERRAHRLQRARGLEHDLGQLAASPRARTRDEIVAGLDERDVRARGAAALEPRARGGR